MGAEKKLEKRCTDVAKANDWFTVKLASPSNRGVPDRLFIKGGKVLFVEFKAPGGKPTPLQADCIQRMQQHGAEVYVIYEVGDFKQLLSIFT